MRKLLTILQASIVLCSMAVGGTAWAETTIDSGAMSGAYYMRDSLVPRIGDLPLIQRKPALYVASFNNGMATVAYSLDDGHIVYQVVKGEIDDFAKAEIDKALVKLQRKLA